MSLEDYKIIESLIDDVIGIKTVQGKTLKKAIKNYFESKPIEVKLVSPKQDIKRYNVIDKQSASAEEAMEKYTAKIKEGIRQLKENGEYCGTNSIWEDT